MATAAAVNAPVNSKPTGILVTTPESLTLLLSNPKAEQLFDQLDTVVLDEWHELMGASAAARPNSA